MNNDVQRRIEQLDDKQSIHFLTLVANGVPGTPGETLAQLRTRAQQANLAFPSSFAIDPEDATLEGHPAGNLARSLLANVALSPSGAQIIDAVLQQPPSTTADFGIISGPVVILVAWLAIAGQARIKIGGIEYHKDGLKPAEQVTLLKSIVPAVIKAFS